MSVTNVLVPVDFSPPSMLAVNYGVSLARLFRAKLTLMHVLEIPISLTRPRGSAEARHQKQQLERAERMLSSLVASEDQDDLDLRIVLKSGDILESGDVQREIASVISEQGADFIVMGTHGRSFFGRLLIGSITQSLLRKLSIPILTICRASGPLSVKRILFATDLSESSKRGLDFAISLAKMTQANLLLLHVTQKLSLTYGGSGMEEYVGEHDIEEARERLSGFEKEAKAENVRVASSLVGGDSAAQEILKFASDNEVDLILITVQKKGLVERAFVGSTAEPIIRDAYVPVVSIPTA